MRSLLLAVAATVGSIATAAHADTRSFTYRIGHLAIAGDCHAEAAQIGRRFQAATGITPTSSRCVDISTAYGMSFELVYEADDPLPKVSTDDGVMIDGLYPDLASCNVALQDEVAHFQQATGLVPVAYGCEVMDLQREYPFSPRVESFGVTLTTPHTSHLMLLDRPVNMEIEDFTTRFKTELSLRGVDVREVTPPMGFYGDMYVRYYGDERMYLETAEMSATDTFEQCDEQLHLANQVRYLQSEPPVLIYCAQSLVSSFYVIAINKDLRAQGDFLSAERFDGYDDCMANLNTILTQYDARNPGQITGALCTRTPLFESRDYKVRLFTR